MLSFNWGTDAETFGNFIILASGVVASCPSSSKESAVFAPQSKTQES
jgi:hypothetical protein